MQTFLSFESSNDDQLIESSENELAIRALHENKKYVFISGSSKSGKTTLAKKFSEIKIKDLPQIKCWEKDGGSFITLPQVYSEDIDKPGILNSNLGMYRIQLSGNQYERR